jgi:hypothetical protein
MAPCVAVFISVAATADTERLSRCAHPALRLDGVARSDRENDDPAGETSADGI